MQNNNSKTLSQNRNTRGGQIYFHEWRMRLQNMNMVMKISLIFLIVGFLTGLVLFKVTTWQLIDLYLLTYIPTHLKIFFWPWIQGVLVDLDLALRGFFSGSKGIPSAYKTLGQLTTDLTLENSKTITFNSIQLINHPWIKLQLASIHKSYLLAFTSWLVGVGYMFYRFKLKSDDVDQEKHLSGKKIVKSKAMLKIITKETGKPNFYISSDVPLPKGSENQHIAIFGATRMGKTNCIINMLQQIRLKGERAIILDVTGEFTSKFYRDGKDKLLNPFDKRSQNWNIWQENLPEHEYDAWAEAMVPDGKGDPIWHGNARKLLSTTAYKLKDNSERSMKSLLEWCCWKPLNIETLQFYKDTAVASFMIKEAEKTAAGVRMQLSNTIAAFNFLNDEKSSFAITDWIQNKKNTDEWLFLTALPSQRSTLAPLLASWFNLAFVGLERSGIDFDTRLWMIADELPGLDVPISGLKRIVAEGAKYGACCMLGFQNKSQIDHLYSHSITKTILSNCSTKVIFRSPDYETAKDLSLAIGEQEVLSVTESYSVGAHQIRDGVNLQGQHRRKYVVTPDEIMALNQLEAYVLLPGDFPTTKVKFNIINKSNYTQNFIPKESNIDQ